MIVLLFLSYPKSPLRYEHRLVHAVDARIGAIEVCVIDEEMAPPRSKKEKYGRAPPSSKFIIPHDRPECKIQLQRRP